MGRSELSSRLRPVGPEGGKWAGNPYIWTSQPGTNFKLRAEFQGGSSLDKSGPDTGAKSTQFLTDFIDNFSPQIAIYDQNGRLVVANRAWSNRETGSDSADLMSIASISADPGEGAVIRNHVLQVLAGTIVRAEMTFSSRVEKKLRFFRLCASPLQRDELRGVMIVVEDISEFHDLAHDNSMLLQQLLQSEEAERRRIAREMHDTTAQDLVAIELNVLLLEASEDDIVTQDILSDVKTILFRVKQEVRTMSYLLHPPILEVGGLLAALESLIAGLARRMELEINFDHDESLPVLSHEIELALFRIIQESLMNVHKHACATSASVSLHCMGDDITLEVKDNGAGVADCVPLGVGIQSMRARLRLLGGKLRISNSSGGTTLKASIPLKLLHGPSPILV